MKKKFLYFLPIVAVAMSVSCTKHYQLEGVQRTRILIDSRYDKAPSAEATAFLAPFKHTVDSMMGPVVGKAASYLEAAKPESKLSNVLSDILVWAAKDFNEKVDFSVYNIGGIRAALAEGIVTYGDVLEVAPFENKICFLDLSGEKVRELFEQIASRGGEGVSQGVRMSISSLGQLNGVQVNGKDIDPQATYRIATIDYLAQGNDGLVAFKACTNVNSPQNEENNVRYIIMAYFRELYQQGKAVDGQVEGRITVDE